MKREYVRSSMKIGGAHVAIEQVILHTRENDGGRVVAEYIICHAYYAYQHWAKMFRAGQISGETFDLIVKGDNLMAFVKPTDLAVDPKAHDRLKSTIEYEKRMYESFSRGEYAKFTATEANRIGAHT